VLNIKRNVRISCLPLTRVFIMAASSQPDSANKLRKLLESMGVHSFEPRVVHQLLEFQQTYLTEIFADSALYAEHAGRPNQLEADDVLLATRLREAASRTTAPKLLESMARKCNKIPINPPTMPGIQLPDPKLCLVEENWQYFLENVQPAPSSDGGAAIPASAALPQPQPSARRIEINLAGRQQQQPHAQQHDPMAIG